MNIGRILTLLPLHLLMGKILNEASPAADN